MLLDGSYTVFSSETGFYPYLFFDLLKYIPPREEVKRAVTVSKFYTLKITEYETKDTQFFYLIEDWLDMYMQSLEDYPRTVQIMIVHDNSRFPYITWQAMINATHTEFRKRVGGA